MRLLNKLALGAAVLALAGGAQAVSVASYDVTGAQPSGFGGWSHNYSGVIVANGSGSYDYSGGSGTLNDGIVPTTYQNNQLFLLADAPTITLNLDAVSTVSAISIFGGTFHGNTIPGTLTGWSVTIGGSTFALASTGFGAGCDSGFCNDVVNLAGTGLDLLATRRVTLSHFMGGIGGYFNAAEITVDAAPVGAVPEPGAYALMLAGLAVVAAVARRRRPAR